jgi:hypothetical protein
MIVATMKVSSLNPIPPAANWRMSFAANAPGGVSDRGDQFYMLANTDAAQTFTWGTAVRDTDGGISYTSRGNCDFGNLDSTNGTITLKVRLAALNAFVTHGPPIVAGSTFWGLRGRTFTSQANGLLDITYGGTSFSSCLGTTSGIPDEVAVRGVTVLGEPLPNPMSRTSTIEFTLGRAGWTDLAVFDVGGRRVRTLLAGNLDRGRYVRGWDGRTDRFSDAAAGVYFYVLHTPAGMQSRKIVLAR